jgi:hypothetical protein
MQIQTAILHCPEDHFFNQQAVMADMLELDEQGILWLTVNKPVSCSDNDAASFDIVLNYHKAGLAFDLDILGDAKVITSHDEIETLSQEKKAAFESGKLLLRVEIIDADYWEQKTPVFKLIAHKLRYMFSGHSKNVEQQLYPDHQMSA